VPDSIVPLIVAGFRRPAAVHAAEGDKATFTLPEYQPL
jgi:hypothetical protein